MKAGLCFQLKDWLGISNIESIEHSLCSDVLDFLSNHPKIKILGTTDAAKRLPIISFLVKHSDRLFLHHNFVAALLNDIFGIQVLV